MAEKVEGPTVSDVVAQTDALQHPALRPRRKHKSLDAKQRRTTVRSVKLINVSTQDGQQRVNLVQVPVEPGHNNGGNLSDAAAPIRFYLNKGFQWPHIYDSKKYPGIYCAVKDCWDWATISNDDEHGTERCDEHNRMFNSGWIRYATAAREYKD